MIKATYIIWSLVVVNVLVCVLFIYKVRSLQQDMEDLKNAHTNMMMMNLPGQTDAVFLENRIKELETELQVVRDSLKNKHD